MPVSGPLVRQTQLQNIYMKKKTSRKSNASI